MKRNILETILGAVVLAVAGFFLVFAYQSSDFQNDTAYEVTARFDRVDGVKIGSDVRIAGVKIGSVIAQQLDHEQFLAVLTLSIAEGVALPSDTAAVISSESLLGGRYVALVPGGAEDMIAPGGRIHFTQSTPGLEQLLGQVIFSMQNSNGPDDTNSAAP